MINLNEIYFSSDLPFADALPLLTAVSSTLLTKNRNQKLQNEYALQNRH